MSHTPLIRAETAADRATSDRVIAAAFGPGRLAKTAERLREGRHGGPAVAMVAEGSDGGVIGVVRLWPVKAGEARALFLGPIAVDAAARRGGLGRSLVKAACEQAAAEGWEAVILVGDPGLFQPMGFSHDAARGLRMPGPVDYRRLLAHELVAGAAERLGGEVAPA